MPNFLNHVRHTTATTGTGTITLGAAIAGFQTFAAAGAADGKVYPYEIRDGDAWELGWGTYTASGTTLARSLIASSTGSLLSLNAGSIVSVVAHAESLRFTGAKVKKSADQTAANYTSLTAIAWDAEEYDTNGFHDNVTNNTRITIPSGLGINYVELLCNVRINLLTADVWHNVFIQMNNDGNLVYGSATLESGNTSGRISIQTGPIAVVAGDYFEAFLQIETDTSVTIPAHVGTFLQATVVG